jgi:hypothetical protein
MIARARLGGWRQGRSAGPGGPKADFPNVCYGGKADIGLPEVQNALRNNERQKSAQKQEDRGVDDSQHPKEHRVCGTVV